jgi:hypothetical protein
MALYSLKMIKAWSLVALVAINSCLHAEELEPKQTEIFPQNLVTPIAFEVLSGIVWEEQAIYLQDVFVDTTGGLPAAQAIADFNRLQLNSTQIGNLFAPFAGQAAATQITQALNEFVTTGVLLVQALEAGNAALAQGLSGQWFNQANSLANYIASLNSNLSDSHLISLFQQYVTALINEAIMYNAGNYTQAILFYDQARQLARQIGFYIASEFFNPDGDESESSFSFS